MLGHAIRPAFRLDPAVDYLNHGAFGATPTVVHDAQRAWQDRFEREPARFVEHDLRRELDAVLDRLGGVLGVPGRDLVFVDNATTGVNAVVGAVVAPGDEVVAFEHGYPAVLNALRVLVPRAGGTLRVLPLPWPVPSSDAIVDALEVGARTRLVVIDHVSSASALRMPVERLVAKAHAAGARVLIDGAHAVGMIPVDLGAIGADWYTTNCHKWLFAPKGCAVVHARADAPRPRHPVVAFPSDDWRESFHWPGTRDHSGWLALGAALDFQERLGPEAIHAHIATVAGHAAATLSAAAGRPVPAPPDCLAGLVPVPVPGTTAAEAEAVHHHLREAHHVQVPVFCVAGACHVRVSAAPYNAPGDYARLAEVLRRMARA